MCTCLECFPAKLSLCVRFVSYVLMSRVHPPAECRTGLLATRAADAQGVGHSDIGTSVKLHGSRRGIYAQESGKVSHQHAPLICHGTQNAVDLLVYICATLTLARVLLLSTRIGICAVDYYPVLCAAPVLVAGPVETLCIPVQGTHCHALTSSSMLRLTPQRTHERQRQQLLSLCCTIAHPWISFCSCSQFGLWPAAPFPSAAARCSSRRRQTSSGGGIISTNPT